MTLLSVAPGIVVLGMGQRTSVVGGEDDDRVLPQTALVERLQDLSDVMIKMLDKGHIHGAFFLHPGCPRLHLREPVGGRLDREMRGVVGEVEQKRFVLFPGAAHEVIRGPLREEFGGMSLRLDDFPVEPQVIVPVSEVVEVAVHHVAEETMEMVKAPLVRRVRRLETEVPFPDDGGVIA